ncbi:MAG: sigma-54-dependent Fis family transcriptional regulator [Nitrospirae bacterium]|nr:MAG: sigma-54-dependent Fis family transcriptional regulator [Nitrospirota bacterium]
MTRLGETKTRKVNVRVIAATHHNLAKDVEQGLFRADLLYRIRVGRIWLPPLRDRREDIPLLVGAFLAHCRAVTGRPIERVSHEAMRELMAYSWPGNVRELKHAIEFAGIRCRGTVIQLEDLPPEILQSGSPVQQEDAPLQVPPAYPHRTSPEIERAKILKALHEAQGNRSLAAKQLGISRVTLYRRLARLGVPPDS